MSFRQWAPRADVRKTHVNKWLKSKKSFQIWVFAVATQKCRLYFLPDCLLPQPTLSLFLAGRQRSLSIQIVVSCLQGGTSCQVARTSGCALFVVDVPRSAETPWSLSHQSQRAGSFWCSYLKWLCLEEHGGNHGSVGNRWWGEILHRLPQSPAA